MKSVYQIGDDLFILIGFVAFIVAVFSRLINVPSVIWGITPGQLFKGAMACLLFSIGLSLRDMLQTER